MVQRMMQLVCVKNVHNRLEELGLDGARVRRELTNPLYSVSLNPEQKMDELNAQNFHCQYHLSDQVGEAAGWLFGLVTHDSFQQFK